jgi:hypothetical protein
LADSDYYIERTDIVLSKRKDDRSIQFSFSRKHCRRADVEGIMKSIVFGRCRNQECSASLKAIREVRITLLSRAKENLVMHLGAVPLLPLLVLVPCCTTALQLDTDDGGSGGLQELAGAAASLAFSPPHLPG